MICRLDLRVARLRASQRLRWHGQLGPLLILAYCGMIRIARSFGCYWWSPHQMVLWSSHSSFWGFRTFLVLLLPVQSVKVLTLSSLLRCLRCVFAWNFGRLVEGLLYFLVFPCVEVFPLVKWSPGFWSENGLAVISSGLLVTCPHLRFLVNLL